MKFCAICTDPIAGVVRREPLGRNDALVDVCGACATETPVAKHGPERSYQGGGSTMKTADAVAGARRAMGDQRYEVENEFLNNPMGAMARGASSPSPMTWRDTQRLLSGDDE